jgi:hypothetical protein
VATRKRDECERLSRDLFSGSITGIFLSYCLSRRGRMFTRVEEAEAGVNRAKFVPKSLARWAQSLCVIESHPDCRLTKSATKSSRTHTNGPTCPQHDCLPHVRSLFFIKSTRSALKRESNPISSKKDSAINSLANLSRCQRSRKSIFLVSH